MLFDLVNAALFAGILYPNDSWLQNVIGKFWSSILCAVALWLHACKYQGLVMHKVNVRCEKGKC